MLLGTTLGCALGADDGKMLGAILGIDDGNKEGSVEGTADGEPLGSRLGSPLGIKDGTLLCTLLGIALGLTDGAAQLGNVRVPLNVRPLELYDMSRLTSVREESSNISNSPLKYAAPLTN